MPLCSNDDQNVPFIIPWDFYGDGDVGITQIDCRCLAAFYSIEQPTGQNHFRCSRTNFAGNRAQRTPIHAYISHSVRIRQCRYIMNTNKASSQNLRIFFCHWLAFYRLILFNEIIIIQVLIYINIYLNSIFIMY